MRILALLLGAALLAACSEKPQPIVAAPKIESAATVASGAPPDHELGRRIYNFRCYFCHGYSGDAQTLASTYLFPHPRNFKATSPEQLSRESMLKTVTNGSDGTAMLGFTGILKPTEIAAVVDFVRQEFMTAKAVNTRYHTTENGWPNHDRYAAAFPFATGKIAIDTQPDQLTAEQRAGRRLFMSTCVSCHDRSKVSDPGSPWESHPLSFPRNGFAPGDTPKVDGVSSATPYHLHDKVPVVGTLSALEQRGETIFQQNCAFCHAADGTARNWIGSFLEPHPRDLTATKFMSTMTHERLAGVIRNGLPGTSMPAWGSVLQESEIEATIAYISKAFHPLAASAPANALPAAASTQK